MREAAHFHALAVILIVDAYVINPRTLRARDFPSLGGQDVADCNGAEVADHIVLTDAALAVGIASESEGAIGEREADAAVAEAVAIAVLPGDGESQHRAPRAHRDQLEAQPFRGLIVAPHGGGGPLGDCLRVHLFADEIGRALLQEGAHAFGVVVAAPGYALVLSFEFDVLEQRVLCRALDCLLG